MKLVSLLCVLLPLAAPAQKLVATTPPITYHVGLKKAPLYHSAADTAGRPSLYLPSQQEAIVVGQLSPRWVVIKHEGFLYLTPAPALSDYDPADAAPVPIDPQTQLIAYEGVVPVPGVSAADLYARAEAWVAKTYSATDVVTRQPAQGELVVQGARRVALRREYAGVLRDTYAGVVHHTLTIYVKDGRFKYLLTDLRHDAAGTPNLQSGGPLEQQHASLYGYAGLGSQKPWADMKVEATRDVRHLMTDLQAAMTLQQPAPPKIIKTTKDPRDF